MDGSWAAALEDAQNRVYVVPTVDGRDVLCATESEAAERARRAGGAALRRNLSMDDRMCGAC